MNSEKKNYKKFNKAILLSAIIFTFCITGMPQKVQLFKADSFVSNIDNQDDFDKKFREGRDLIDREEWAKASEKFSEIIGKYPKNKSTDAALYWLAFCQKRLKQFKEADATLNRLIKEFPNSSWTDDGGVMKVEMGFSFPDAFSGSNSNYREYANSLLGSGDAKTAGFTVLYGNLQKTPLDREDEIKLAAFQSLLSADPKRGIETLGEILKPNSTAGETLKREVLRMMRSSRLIRNKNVSSGSISSVFSISGEIDEKLLPLLRETLIKSYKNEPNVKIRQEIIYVLANTNDEQSADYLTELYNAENNKEIKKAIINSFGGSSNFVFSSSFNNALNLSLNNSQTQKSRFDKLWEIVRTEKDSELKRLALSNLQRFGSLLAQPNIIEELSKMYDSETDEQFKTSIIRTFSNIKQDQAAKKLFDIAKNEKSDKLKLEAIRSLRTSNDPKVLKFLEDLIK